VGVYASVLAHVRPGGFAQRGRGGDGIALQSCPPAATRLKRESRELAFFEIVWQSTSGIAPGRYDFSPLYDESDDIQVTEDMLYLVLCFVMAIIGQILLSYRNILGLGPYAVAIVLLLAMLRQNTLAGPGELVAGQAAATPWLKQSRYWRWRRLLLSLVLPSSVVAFLAASGNTHRWWGVVAWILALTLPVLTCWERSPGRWFGVSRGGWRPDLITLAVAGFVLCAVWFRFWQLDALPPEMNIDHVANLVDVHELELGQRPIFFERNNGRESFVFYWTLLLTRVFDLELKFLALKLSSALVSLLMLPGIYLLAKEMFGRWVGLWAILFTAVASWPVLLSRIGLRSILTPVVSAWALLFLFRGLRHGRRNDFLLLGLSLGIGLYGYTAFRIMPLTVVACWALAWRAARSAGRPRPRLWRNALLTVLVALIVFIPLGRYSLERPDEFWYRSFTRVNAVSHH
jgi:hypothetical protein